jgi:hypothetical protein
VGAYDLLKIPSDEHLCLTERQAFVNVDKTRTNRCSALSLNFVVVCLDREYTQ